MYHTYEIIKHIFEKYNLNKYKMSFLNEDFICLGEKLSYLSLCEKVSAP